ncbi:ester cyclase [Paeniglutamicibacter sp. NPDC012692]|uniref:ester cyclase n=1 Tax=Paeniglutamicibacter sp. NPDC012692 TaxID=3364388 RepID=UPI003685467E
MTDAEDTRRVVKSFLEEVRSGRSPERAGEFMAPRVLAHQVQSEDPRTVERSPDDYAGHVREMTETWGAFALEVEEFIVEGKRAHVRFSQNGHHMATVEGYLPTRNNVQQINSVVYEVEDGLITQYWMHIDRAGVVSQLARASI